MNTKLHALRNQLILLGVVLGVIGLSFTGWWNLQRVDWLHYPVVFAQQSLPTLQGVAATEYLKQQGLYTSLTEAVAAINSGTIAALSQRDEQQLQGGGEAGYPMITDPFTQQAKLQPIGESSGGASYDLFGNAVAVSGNIAVIGARNASSAQQGAVYVFVRSGTTWVLQQKLMASNGTGFAEFGSSVAVSGDTIIIGAAGASISGLQGEGAAYVFVRDGTDWIQQQVLAAFDHSYLQNFGISVAVDNNTAVIGAYGNQGTAYVFVRSGVTWTQQQKLIASDGMQLDRFGVSVTLSGNTIMVGAFQDDVGSNPDQGSVYVFTRNGVAWTEQQKLLAADGAAGDQFGISLAMNSDTAVIGASQGSVGSNAAQGAAYVFVRNGTAWTQRQKLMASDGTAGDQFGASLSLNGDTVVIGAFFDAINGNLIQGSAYVFVRSGMTWTQQQKLEASDGAAENRFGISVAVQNDTVVIGADLADIGTDTSQGSAYVFVRNGATWTQEQKLISTDLPTNDRFGNSVAMSGDTVVIGAYLDSVGAFAYQGSAYVFVRSGTTWSLQQKLTASDSEGFGTSVAVSGDTVVIGAPRTGVGLPPFYRINQGATYVFVRNGTTWSLQQRLTASDGDYFDLLGATVAVSGDTAVIGAVGDTRQSSQSRGSAYVFVRNGATWSQQQKLEATDGMLNDVFGRAVAVSGDTAVVVNNPDLIGANPNPGSAYVFIRNGTSWSLQQKLTSPVVADAVFGSSVAVSDETIMLGAFHENIGSNFFQGAVYIFVRSGTTWLLRQKLTASDGTAFANFGASVSMSGNTAVIGASTNSIGTVFAQGSAYVFMHNGTAWSQNQKLVASDGAAQDFFGSSVALSAGLVIVGSPYHNLPPFQDTGAAYVFNIADIAPTITAVNLTQRAGSPAQSRQIATIGDADQAANTLVVTVNGGASATVNGVTVNGISINPAGQVTANIVAAANATTANFTLRVTDSVGAFADATLTVAIVNFSGSVSDPLVCTGPGNTVGATLVLGNPNGAPLSVSNTTTFTNLIGVPGSCTVTPNVGTCTVTNANLTYTATLAANQTVTITYLTQVADNVTAATQVCTNNAASFGGGAPVNLQVCGTINCPIVGPGFPFNAASPMSDQRAGSVLIYNVYTSATDPTRQNTRLSITNVDPGRSANVHLFFVDGASCSVADSFLCLTPNQTTSFLASDFDPGTTGYVVAVATDENGCPVNFNFLIGDEYVKFASGHAANLSAQAITAIAGGLPFCDQNSSTATLSFDGVSYAMVPRVLALDNVASRADGNDTLLVVNRIGGNLATGASTLGTLFGILYNDAEAPQSFSVTGACQLLNSLSNNFPRTAPRFEQFIPAGRSGWLKLSSQSDFGITGAAINFNADAGTNANAFNQGHNLHELTLTSAAGYTIPVFPPGC